jgi:hypothetical protein
MRAARIVWILALSICAGISLVTISINTTAATVVTQRPADSNGGYLAKANRVINVNSTLTPTVWLPVMMRSRCIEITYLPPYGSTDDLRGRVTCVEPGSYKVAVYIYVSGWWTKPYWNRPLTPIQDDGTWICDITTGGNDPLATEIAAFLIPNVYPPPSLGGQQTLPEELFANAVDYVIADRPPPIPSTQGSKTE